MGMNYYAYVEPESYSKYGLIESIVENNPVKIQENYVNTIANNIIHLGKNLLAGSSSGILIMYQIIIG